MLRGRIAIFLAAGCGLLAGPQGAAADPPSSWRIIGGAATTIATHPHQVALLDSSSLGQFCGGSLLDATHVATAAHCVELPAGQGGSSYPGDIKVFAGHDDLFQSGQAQVVDVVKISFPPTWSPSTNRNDVAVLELANAITDPQAATVPLAGTGESALAGPGAELLVSGWGNRSTSGDDYPNVLHAVDVVGVSDASCNGPSSYNGGIDPSVMVCAARPGKDSCQGDSGGPLVSGSVGAYKLVGIVSFGTGCALAAFPGVYTKITAPSINAFLANRASLPNRPNLTGTAASIAGVAKVGETLTCNHGTPIGTGVTMKYQWGYQGTTTAATDYGPEHQTYVPIASDAGKRVYCVAVAENDGGYAERFSSPTGTIAAGPAPAPTPTPAPTSTPPPAPTPTPAPSPAATPTPASPSALDRTPPTGRLLTRSCSRGACTLNLQIADAGAVAPLRSVTAKSSTRVRRRCGTKKKRRTCLRTETKTVSVLRTGTDTFRLSATRLRRGAAYTFTVRAVDAVGNAATLRFTARTKKR